MREQEIVKWLTGLANGEGFAAYLIGEPEKAQAAADAIEQLIAAREKYTKIAGNCHELIVRLIRERDAAVRDIEMTLHGAQLICAMCDLRDFCEDYGNDEAKDSRCDEAKWRGICAANGRKDDE